MTKMEWIKCSERMPDDGEEVLVFQDPYKYMAKYRYKLGWHTYDNPLRRNGTVYLCLMPTHWMSIPDKIKEENGMDQV